LTEGDKFFRRLEKELHFDLDVEILDTCLYALSCLTPLCDYNMSCYPDISACGGHQAWLVGAWTKYGRFFFTEFSRPNLKIGQFEV
jgi:hypothetical protein